MSWFLRNAEEIFSTARSAAGEDCEMTLLVDAMGGIRVASDLGWSLEGLRAHHGAGAAYRVSRRGASVRMEAFDGDRRCVLESGGGREWRHVLCDVPRYAIEVFRGMAEE